MPPSSPVVCYRIDARDHLVAVNPAWDEWAAQNEGDSVQSSRVLGRPLWSSLSGATVRELYWHLCQRVRTGVTARFPFRCDSPFERRVFEMQAAPAGEGGVSSRAVRIERSAPQPLLDVHRARSDEFVTMCSWCHGVKLAAGWAPLEEALARLHLEEASRLPRLSHGVCDACSDRFFAAVKAASPEPR